MLILAKLKYLVRNVPAPVRTAVEHAAVAAGAAFVATANPLLPAIVATPSLGLAKAGFVAAGVAAVTAAYHVLKSSGKALGAKWAAIPTTPAPVAAPQAGAASVSE